MAGAKVATQDGNARQFLPPCRVCGDKAAGFHYGVNTCEACKGFFHRSLRRYKEYKCRANRTAGFCEYKPGKRKSCQYCRYKKCLHAGMSKDAIKTGRYTYIKRTEDTEEIKRLQDLKYRINQDSQDLQTELLSSFSNSSACRSYTGDFNRNDCHADNSMEVDFAATNEFETSSVEANDLCYSLEDFSSSDGNDVAKSFISASTKCHNRFRENNRQGNQTQSTTKSKFSSNKHSGNSPELSLDGHMPCTDQTHDLGKLDFSASQDSDSDQKDKFSLLSPLDSETTSHLDQIDFPLTPQIYMKTSDGFQDNGSSVIHILLSHTQTGKKNGFEQKTKLESSEFFPGKELGDLNMNTLADTDSAPLSVNSAVSESTNVSSCEPHGSISPSICTIAAGSKDLIGSSFDLFPDISFCLAGQPISGSPSCVLSEVMEPASVLMMSSGLLSPMTSQSPQSNVSSVSSPGLLMLNLDNGKQLKVGADLNIVADLCSTPEPSCLEGDEMSGLNEENITLKIMEDYTHGLEFVRDSPGHLQGPTPVQTLLTSPSPEELKSVSPQSSPGSDLNESSHTQSTSSKLLTRVKNLQLSDISELYRDMDAVIAMLMASHKEHIGNFKFLPKEEMRAQQEAHYESCKLKKQTFGDLGFLPDQEYDDLYSATGIDVDNRRMIIQKYLSRMEKAVQGLVLFAKTIPGFSTLDINTQVELIKLARSEIGIFTMYPSVNLELGVNLGLTGENWTCSYDMGRSGYHLSVTEYMTLCDKLQKLAPTEEEEVILKAIIVITTDRDNAFKSPLAEVIRWQLVLCLMHSLEKHREQPGLVLARYIMVLAQSRTVTENMKDFFRQLKLQKYSSIEQNPLMWEMFSGILQEKEGEPNWGKLCQDFGVGKISMWSPCLLG